MRKLSENLIADSMIESQIDLENKSLEIGAAAYRKTVESAIKRKEGASLSPCERLMTHWMLPVMACIEIEQRHITAGRPALGRNVYGLYMMMLEPHIIAQIAIYQMMSQCMFDPLGVKVSKVAYEIGNHCLAEIECKSLKKKKLIKQYRDGKRYQTNEFAELMSKVDRMDPKSVHRKAKLVEGEYETVWSRRVAGHLGAFLLCAVQEVASSRDYTNNPNDFTPAFESIDLYQGNGRAQRYTKCVRMSDETFAIIDEGHQYRSYLRPRFQPMIVKPMVWGKDLEGGYIKIRKPLVTRIHPSQKKKIRHTDMPMFYKAINTLSSTGWKVNPHIFKVMDRIWQNGGGVAGIPLADEIPIPPKNPRLKKDSPRWKAERRERFGILKRNCALRGQRTMFMRRLRTASDMLQYPVFYQPQQSDFRGRFYSMAYDLNHQADDSSRALLLLANPKPLRGSEDWLKIHAANLYGCDKFSFEKRCKWVDSHAADISSCTSNPLSSRALNFWTKADSPWQFLAACYGLEDSSVGKCIAVQVDGTCNGLQHYAAFGRDSKAAALVNMIDSDAPVDTYTEVAKTVALLAMQHAADGHREAAMICDHITRSLIKQPIMTNVYGVTDIGVRKQIYNQLAKMGLVEKDKYDVSRYLSKVTMQGIGRTCESAEKLMSWLKSVARVIVGKKPSDNEFVSWTSPIGFPVVQRYMEPTIERLNTAAGRLRMYTAVENTKVKKGKQISSFPPNVVHAVDSSHLSFTACSCGDAGIELGTIHDAFATHAASTDSMIKILKHEFVAMHEQDPLGQMLDEFKKAYPDKSFPERPPLGNLDLQTVVNARYMFH